MRFVWLMFFPFSHSFAGHFFPDVWHIPRFIIFDLNESKSESRLQMSKSLSAHLLVPNRKTTQMNGASSADQVLLWGVGLLESYNCWMVSFDELVQLNRESLSRAHDGDRGCSVWNSAPLRAGLCSSSRRKWDETLTVTLWCDTKCVSEMKTTQISPPEKKNKQKKKKTQQKTNEA